MANGSFATAPASLANLSHLTPRPIKGLFADNYIPVDQMDFTQQFLPEVYEKEVERFGNRTISGFLRMVGAEMPMASDQVVWSEQGRLHIAYGPNDATHLVAGGAAGATITIAQTAAKPSLIGAGMTLVINLGPTTVKAFVKSVANTTAILQTVTIEVYNGANAAGNAAVAGKFLPVALWGSAALNVFVYGSEYGKGTDNASQQSVDSPFTKFDNKPIIMKGKYEISGSDTAQIGWVEVATEAGASGYLWYLKSESETRIRFEDKLEMAMIEAEKAVAASGLSATFTGSEGLFAAIESRGLVYNNQGFANACVGGGIDEFDAILQELDKQGAIEENMMFLDRATSLGIDNMLAAQNSYGAGGTSFGVFNNEEDMALNLGFSGFRRGSYDFYKTDWKYLNDSTTRGSIGDIEGVIVPAGTSTVYDQSLGQNISRPFLHIRYRASEADDRRMKSWITGSVGGNYTSSADTMTVNMLSERTICTQAANNFVLLKKTV